MGPSLLEILTFLQPLFAMMWVKIIVGNLLFVPKWVNLWSQLVQQKKECIGYNNYKKQDGNFLLVEPQQKARREFSAGGASAVRHSVMPHQMGLLKTPEREENPLSPSTNEALKDPSPFKDLMATLEKPADLTAHPGTPVGHFGQLANVTSPPHSAGYLPKKTPNFFQNFTRNRPNFKIPRSSSMRTPSPPGGSSGMLSPGQTKPLGVSSTPGSFQALSKIRKSLRDKKSSSTAGLPSSAGSEPSAGTGTTPSPLGRTFSEAIDHREIANLKEDLQAVREKASADEEVISVLQKQVEELQKEKETLTSLQKDNFDDDHLLEILRTKDTQIVELENSSRDKQVENDRINQQLEKVQTELTVFRDLLENKDDQIVKLTNQIHEIELKNVMHESVPPSPGGPRTPHLSNLSLHKLQLTGRASSNGISFDSDKGEFKEFIDVGSQTRQQTSMHGQEVRASEHVTASLSKDAASGDGETTSLPDVEKLQDTVTAYEMQNKFLNKEVLELNQLRQQAIDREQKLFIESSDWEAKFYQIQSKYLLLLNELHNPQAGVSASRQEMVSQLLKDIVEVGDRPTLASKSAAYDRFGFAIETPGNTLEEKAEFLRKQAENNHDNLEDGAEHDEHREKKWDEAIASLNSKTPFTMTTDLKNLLRLGIPISQRCTVWKATVDHKLMRVQNDKFEANYYKKLLANCSSSGQKLTSAAKQIELDLLRTLPNNKHYDGPNADGIPKLRRVLLAYSVHNPDVEYCQGFNRLVAIALLFMAEEDAFWCLVYIIEHLMPAEYYSRDKQLIGAQVDQEVLKELLAEKLPKLQQHFTKHGVDPALFTLNWFLCVFVDTVPVKTYLHIWDAFLFEGSKVLFRYAIAIFKYMETGLLKQGDYMSIYNTLRDGLEYLTDTQTLTQIAFHELNPFPMRTINHKREHHYKVLEAQKKELDHIREEYHRKNSVARTPRSSRDTSGKNEDED